MVGSCAHLPHLQVMQQELIVDNQLSRLAVVHAIHVAILFQANMQVWSQNVDFIRIHQAVAEIGH